MFKKVVFWCEFPETVDWKRLESILAKLDMDIAIYVPAKNLQQFLWWKKEIQKNCQHIAEVGAWPILEKKDGYWFSGFTSEEKIKSLKQFSTLKIKVDLELPIPKRDYSNSMILGYFSPYLLKKGKSSKLLLKTIKEMSENTNIIINEFPFPRYFLRRWGMHLPLMKNCTRNIMAYTTIGGPFLRPFIKSYVFIYLLKERMLNKHIMCSIGLIGNGILKKESVYNNVKQFKSDLDMARFLGIKQVAIYSIDSILKRNNSEEWLNTVKSRTLA